MTTTCVFPLDWPEGWPRTPAHQRRFNWQLKHADWNRSLASILAEVRRLNGRDLVISTNQPVRGDGMPYAAKRLIEDPGVAIYFRRGQRQIVMARDAYERIEQNLRSLALALDHLRGLERHGGAVMMDRAFDGFAALPPPDAAAAADAPALWWDVLGIGREIDTIRGLPKHMQGPLIDQAYRDQAKRCHPDAGGSGVAMAALNAARASARKELGL